ncbi:MAG TPA: glutathione peroxidase [Stellaceae bacterium]|nr:glutathione peroxidase [Stellaceae bacterium]
MTAWEFTFASIDGGALPLEQFRGKVMLVVNTASHCGLTPQYEGLETLYRSYRDGGFVLLGVPSNDFGQQEPGTAEEIKTFCTAKFAVDFPLAGKESVVGETAHPFYRWVVAEKGQEAAPRWNFHKVLIGRDGEIAGVYGSRIPPADLAVSIRAALDTPAA